MLGAGSYAAAGLAIVAWIVLIYVVIDRPVRSCRPSPRRFCRDPSPVENRWNPAPTTVEQQLHAVVTSSFQRRRLLSSLEYQTFKVIEDCVAASRRGYRVFAQTSLGEILASPDEHAYRSINSKRVDILIVDRGGWPVLAVEYQGGAHYQGAAAIRDAVKKEALLKAGVGYAEVFRSDSPEEIRLLVRERLGWKPCSASAREIIQA
jgi:uncharacterized protein DUF2726